MDAQVCEASADQATRAESGATCEASTSDEPTLPLMADIIQALDEKLYFVTGEYGFPVWITEGRGCNDLSNERHKSLTYRWKEGARVDFYHGRAEDDWINISIDGSGINISIDCRLVDSNSALKEVAMLWKPPLEFHLPV